MGFFTKLGRLVAGKPIFQVEDMAGKSVEDREDDHDTLIPVDEEAAAAEKAKQATAQQAQQDQQDQVVRNKRIDANGKKIIPVAEIIRTDTKQPNDEHCEVWITIKNLANFTVFIDKIVIMGQTMEVDRPLEPGQSHEVIGYRGSPPSSNAYTKAELYYRDQQAGDYFCAEHAIRYDVNSGGDWEIRELTLLQPIKDV